MRAKKKKKMCVRARARESVVVMKYTARGRQRWIWENRAIHSPPRVQKT